MHGAPRTTARLLIASARFLKMPGITRDEGGGVRPNDIKNTITIVPVTPSTPRKFAEATGRLPVALGVPCMGGSLYISGTIFHIHFRSKCDQHFSDFE